MPLRPLTRPSDARERRSSALLRKVRDSNLRNAELQAEDKRGSRQIASQSDHNAVRRPLAFDLHPPALAWHITTVGAFGNHPSRPGTNDSHSSANPTCDV